QKLLAVDGHVAGGLDTQADLPTVDVNDRDANIVADIDLFAEFSAQDQHVATLLRARQWWVFLSNSTLQIRAALFPALQFFCRKPLLRQRIPSQPTFHQARPDTYAPHNSQATHGRADRVIGARSRGRCGRFWWFWRFRFLLERILDGPQTVGTYAVTEAHRGVLAEVFLDALPVVLVVADLAAPGADRQECLQSSLARQGR